MPDASGNVRAELPTVPDILKGFVPISGGVYLLFMSILGWQKRVNENVPKPYLDEFFHIRQAQKYCSDDWSWDPKITTPPGLYVFSWLWNRTPGLGPSCDVESLRSLNYLFIVITLIPLAFGPNSIFWPGKSDQSVLTSSLLSKSHLALNIALFPVLWFFSGLYYTDIASTAFVVMTLSSMFLAQQEGYGLLQQLDVFLRGLAALTFRQTNIFWVAIFPAGLVLIEQLRQRSFNMHTTSDGRGFWEAFVLRKLYEQGVGEASALDYGMTAISLVLNVLDYMRSMLTETDALASFIAIFWPYLSLIAAFAAFVIVNGGVVLGDKSNHVPALHLPQILYLAAYIVLFDLPLIYPRLVSLLPPNVIPSFVKTWTTTRPLSASIRLVIAIFVSSLLLIPVIHYNTIIHPFILADNRHYVFYIFRILRLNSWVKYALAPVYGVAGWSIVQTLGRPSPPIEATAAQDQANANSTDLEIYAARIKRDEEARTTQVTTAWVLLWILTSGLCLVTAPLVEPRYYIIPWLVWRWHVPTTHSAPTARRSLWHGDHRVVLETVWFALINLVTGYMFLYKPFRWASEPLAWQRFMW